MKKSAFAILTAVLLIFSAFFSLPFSAEEEFEISENVLIKYNGSSQTVDIPDGVEKIGDNAFNGNSSVVSVNLSDSVYSIGNYAFYGCSSLESLGNTSGITDIGAHAFANTAFLDSADEDFISINNILIGYSGENSDIEIPSGIISLAPYSLTENSSLTSVEIPESVRQIGEGAFFNCSALESITVPDEVIYIGVFAFYGTPWFENLPDGFVILGDSILVAFKGNMADVRVPEGVKQIGGGAFFGNPDVEKITVQNGCSAVQLRAFADCPKLSCVVLPDSLLGIDPLAFENSPNVKIQGSQDSFAQKFANKYSLPFEIYEQHEAFGDVNRDGNIDSTDATLILQYFAEIIKDNDDIFFASLADVNSDGIINSADATVVLQIFAEISTPSLSAPR